MTKVELIAHLANMTLIMDHHENLGTVKNKFLRAEYVACEKELNDLFEKEEKDAARKSPDQPHGRDEARAEVPRG